MKRILIDTNDVTGIRFEYYKFNDGTYGFKHLERFGPFWHPIGAPNVGWSKAALEYEHSITLPE